MATSYPRRDSGSGIWKLSDITSNIKNQGTWPDNAAGRGFSAGGITPTVLSQIDYVTISTTGDAADFGDLTLGKLWTAGGGAFVRAFGMC